MKSIQEHDKLEVDDSLSEQSYQCLLETIRSVGYNYDPKRIEDLSCLGLTYDYKKKELLASYFIGLEWIPNSKEVLRIVPKRDNVSYLKMFLSCLNSSDTEVQDALSEIYYIAFDRPVIALKLKEFELTPFLISHFVTLVQAIVKRGLKFNYSFEEDNLNSKIKGKLLIGQQIKRNIACNQSKRNYCRYQIYTLDCLENKLLKRALIFCKHYLTNAGVSGLSTIEHTLQQCLSKFQDVSDDIDVKKISQIKINPLFKEYARAMKLAKMILRRFGYDINNADENIDTLVPPFRINMALLFEVYAYSKLIELYPDIEYQAKGKYGNIDFLSKPHQLFIDTKYKDLYNKNEYCIEDIRQISGYSRDKGLLKKIGLSEDKYKTYAPKCLIIYPLDENREKKECLDINNEKEPIEQFTNFYKMGITLPLK